MWRKWGCVTSSAFLFVVPFWYPSLCAWFVFIFLVPLFYAAVRFAITWREGLVWGLIVFGTLLHPLTRVVHEHGSGKFRLLAAALLIMWSAAHAAVWFWATQGLAAGFGLSPVRMIFCWGFTAFCYVIFVDRWLLWFLWPVQGYPFINLLVPLAIDARWLQGVPYTGSELLLLLLILVGIGITLCIIKHQKRWLVLSCIGLAPFVYGWVIHKQYLPPAIIQTIGCIPPAKKRRAMDMAAEIATQLSRGVRKGSFSVLVLPESAFPYPLNEFPEALSCWAMAQGELPLVLGSHRKAERLYNTLYVVKGGRIINYYDKKRLVPFTESMPINLRNRWLQTIFLGTADEFFPGEQARDCECVNVTQDQLFQPLICSELFLGIPQPCPHHPTIPLICMLNESWFMSSWQRKLMILLATLQAMRTRRSILYVSHESALWITATGGVHSLPRL